MHVNHFKLSVGGGTSIENTAYLAHHGTVAYPGTRMTKMKENMSNI